MSIDLENELDTLVDAASLTAVLGALVQVCSAKRSPTTLTRGTSPQGVLSDASPRSSVLDYGGLP